MRYIIMRYRYSPLAMLLLLTVFGCASRQTQADPKPSTVAIAPRPTSPSPPPKAPAPEPPQKSKRVKMNNDRLDAWLKKHAQVVGGRLGAWKLEVDGRALMLLTDETHDRMRIITPVIEASNMTAEQVGAILVANFHTALDARYAVHDGVLYAAFIHPLSPLSGGELTSALKQVATLAANFGTSYSSGELVFGRP